MGYTDGSFKSLTPSRGGDVEEGFALKRQMVVQSQYNLTPKSPLAEAKDPVISL
jgi:hypothetical protein